MSSEHATEQVPLAEIREGDTIQDPTPVSGSPSPEPRTAQRVSLTSTQMATGRSPKGIASITATNDTVNMSIPGASSIPDPLRASSPDRCESNRERPCDDLTAD
jgi:hypothetical protein